jgi:hypothetical protein
MGNGPEERPDLVPAPSDPATLSVLTPSAVEPVPALAPSAVQSAEHLNIAQARDLLDWLDGQGVRADEVKLEPDGTMTVRWRR